jgi:hypothetical protein
VPNGGLDRALEACNSCLIDASRQSGRAEPGAGTAALGLKAFLIADVRGYTRYTSEQGEPAAARMADVFLGLGRESVEGAGGVVIGVRGDEIAGMFDSPRRAVEAAIDLRERVAAELPLPIGVGLDVGEVEVAERNYVSGALNLASRLCDLAGAERSSPPTRLRTWRGTSRCPLHAGAGHHDPRSLRARPRRANRSLARRGRGAAARPRGSQSQADSPGGGRRGRVRRAAGRLRDRRGTAPAATRRTCWEMPSSP